MHQMAPILFTQYGPNFGHQRENFPFRHVIHHKHREALMKKFQSLSKLTEDTVVLIDLSKVFENIIHLFRLLSLMTVQEIVKNIWKELKRAEFSVAYGAPSSGKFCNF